MFKREDIYVGIASILVAIFIIFQSRDLVVRTPMDPAGPTFVPLVIAWGMIFIGIILIAGGLYALRLTQASVTPSGGFLMQLSKYQYVLLIVAISLAYGGLLDTVGYLIMTPILIGGIMWVLKVRDIKQILKVAIPLSLVLYVVFRFGLQVKLPLGVFEFLVN
jgi:hypothetical protein